MMNNILSKLKGFFNASNKWLLEGFDVADQRKKAYDFACSVCERWDVPRGGDVPADLRDERGHWYKTRDGKLITGIVFKSDLMQGDESVRTILLSFLPIIIGGLAAVVAVINVVLYLITYKFGWMSGGTFGVLMSAEMVVLMLFSAILVGLFVIGLKVSPMDFVFLFCTAGIVLTLQSQIGANVGASTSPFSLAIIFIVSFVVVYVRNNQLQRMTDQREFGLELQGGMDTGENSLVDKLLNEHRDARLTQAKNAAADISTFIPLGQAKGTFSEIGDKYAPDAGLPFGMSVADLSTGLFIFGQTGSGKTSSMLRPIARAISRAIDETGCKVGMLVLDGKGELPVEMSGVDNYQLIAPGIGESLSLTQGLNAEELVAAIVGLQAGDSKADFWVKSGETLLRSASIILEELRDKHSSSVWTLANIRRACTDASYRDNLIKTVGEVSDVEMTASGMLPAALRYFQNEFGVLADNTKTGVIATVDSWLSPILGHRDLLPWAETSGGLDVESILKGGRIGISVPEFKYGTAGRMISTIIKARIYNALKVRGSGWKAQDGQTSVALIVDEAQSLLGESDIAMLAVGRSLGLRPICASQHIEGIEVQLGEEKAHALLGNFVSLVSFISTPATLEYVAGRMGSIPRRQSVIGEANGMNVSRMFETTFAQAPHSIAKLDYYDSVGSPKGSPGAISGALLARMTRKEELPDVHVVKVGEKGEAKTTSPFAFETEIAPLMNEGEAEAWLRAPFNAVGQVMRGGVIRRDVFKATPVFN